MKRHPSERTRTFAKGLRSDMPPAEARLWALLRAGRFQDWKFRRQVPIGSYIADFVCHEAKLIIEADGHQHADTEAADHDRVRTAFMAAQGYRVLRFWNDDIYNQIDSVLEAIYHALEGTLPADRFHNPLP